MTGRTVLVSLFAACFGLLAAGPAVSQHYPNRVIKMIVPFPPGGPIDTMARLVAHELSARLGQDAVIENRPGAGSTLGSRAAAGAEADGYTLVFGSSGSLAVAPALYAKLNIEPLKLFVPVAAVSLLPSWHRPSQQKTCRSSSHTPKPIRASSTTALASAHRRIS